MSNVNVLLVDDQPAKLMSYEVMLKDLEVNLISANSASNALAVLLKTDVAVVLIDVCMPELDGFELASMIRNHPRYQETALIFVSAINISETDHLRGYDAGAVDYVSVPVVPQILRAKVKVFSELYRKSRQLAELNRDLERRVANRTAALEASTSQLLQSERRRSLALAAAQMGSWEYDVINNSWTWDEGQARIFGIESPATQFTVAALKPVIHPDDWLHLNDIVETLAPDSTTRQAEIRIIRPNGEERWCFVVAAATFDSKGRLSQISGVTLDIHDRKVTEQRQALLAREVDHRARNALALVATIVRMTKSDSVGNYTAAVEGRVRALAHCHDLLAQARWQGADVARLIGEELAPYSEGGPARVAMAGPAIILDSNRAQTISLAVHELATNAAKHGGLSVPQGKVAVNWSIANGTLSIDWREQDGPPVTPPARAGFGSKIIDASVSAQLGAAHFDWRPDGLHCRISIPLLAMENIVSLKAVETEPSTSNPTGLRILVMEDEPLIAMATCDLIEELGHHVVGPFFNIAASRAALAGQIDAAILDVNLGGEEAYPIAEELAARRVPFMFMTGYGQESVDMRFRQHTILQKPVIRNELELALINLTSRPEPLVPSALANG